MKENFSKRVQSILKKAKEEAIRLGHSYVGSEHILLGLLKEKAGNSHKLLKVYDIEFSEMIAMIEDLIKAFGGTMTLGHLPLTRRAERVLRNAYSEAASRGYSLADDNHLFLALLQENDGIAFEVLKSFNLDFDLVADYLMGEGLEKDIDSPMLESSSKSRTPTLDHFSRDITKLSQLGKLD
ncbi:uncharacterized protein METZ01_LOCUS97715, partial [marine metagenome]